MSYTKDDVGSIPGKPLLTDDQKQAIADEWNANEAAKPLRRWVAEMRELDRQIIADSRFWEEVATGAVSQPARDRMDALIAERKAKRALRP